MCPSDPDSPEPTPHVDPRPPEGPGGPDAVPDWEGAQPDPVVPDQPRSAQVESDDVPDELDEPEDTDEADDPDAPARPEEDSPA